MPEADFRECPECHHKTAKFIHTSEDSHEEDGKLILKVNERVECTEQGCMFIGYIKVSEQIIEPTSVPEFELLL